MPKPTLVDILSALNYDGHWAQQDNAARVMDLIDAWEAEGSVERERGRKALEIVDKYAGHFEHCEYARYAQPCSCGFEGAMAELDELVLKGMTSVYVADEVAKFNREQRIRREACEAALPQPTAQERASIAAHRYPLKKRVPKVIDDPHGAEGGWSYDGDKFCLWNPRGQIPSAVGPAYTPERIRVLAALLNDPWAWEDDHSVEET